MGAKKQHFQSPFILGYKEFALMRGFQKWSQNSNRITFDPFVTKKLSKTGKIPNLASFEHFLANRGSNVIHYEFWDQIWQNTRFCHSRSFLANMEPNVIHFEFWDHIWKPLIKANILNHKMYGSWVFDPLLKWLLPHFSWHYNGFNHARPEVVSLRIKWYKLSYTWSFFSYI